MRSEDLGKAIEGMRALNIRGGGVTIPHKVAIIPFLVELDPIVEKVGAVNRIVNNDGVVKGYNTDGTGCLQGLLESGIEPKGKNVVILGAGGASRCISFTLAERGSNLFIINRTLEKAEKLARSISQSLSKEVEALELNEKNLARVLERANILINTTSLGMSPNIDLTPLPSNLLKPSLVVFDIVYNPMKTRLLREAEAAGAKIISGVEMLVWQGVTAFELSTGLKAPVEVMRAEVIKGLTKS